MAPATSSSPLPGEVDARPSRGEQLSTSKAEDQPEDIAGRASGVWLRLDSRKRRASSTVQSARLRRFPHAVRWLAGRRRVSPLDEDDLVLVCCRRKAGVELGVDSGQLIAVDGDGRRGLEQITGDDFLDDRVGQVRIRS